MNLLVSLMFFYSREIRVRYLYHMSYVHDTFVGTIINNESDMKDCSFVEIEMNTCFE